jgi:hypothetical protein
MKTGVTARFAVAASLAAAFWAAHWAFGNGGPFVVKHPNGDPAAKGVLARIDPSLKPTRETRLRVLKEDLTIRFTPDRMLGEHSKLPPLVNVTAAYRIENTTDQEVVEDFGFPILRGIYLNPLAMMPTPQVHVQVDKDHVRPTVISNSVIYGMIRQNAREVIERGIAADGELARLYASVRDAGRMSSPPAASRKDKASQSQPSKKKSSPPSLLPLRERPAQYRVARENLHRYLTTNLQWNDRDAALLVEYVSLDLTRDPTPPGAIPFPFSRARDVWDHGGWWFPNDKTLATVKTANLGPLAAIGEQKATQFFAQLASKFDKDAGSTYEAVFAAWGGDVRERSVDMETGQLRPRELTLPERPASERFGGDMRLTADPTVYARVDYLDPNVKMSDDEKRSCQAILKNLQVVFTFAPMNLLYYQVKFPPHGTRTVTVTYEQYAYADTRGSGSYQLAYVLHPATLWNEFGPIQVRLEVPKGVATCKASAPLAKTGEVPATESEFRSERLPALNVYQATLSTPEEKQNELFVAVDKATWDKLAAEKAPPPKPAVGQSQRPVRQTTPKAKALDPFE